MQVYLRMGTLVWPEDDDPCLRSYLRKLEQAAPDIDCSLDILNIPPYFHDAEPLEAIC